MSKLNQANDGFIILEDDVWLASGFHEILRWATLPLYDDYKSQAKPKGFVETFGSVIKTVDKDADRVSKNQFMISLYNPDYALAFDGAAKVNEHLIRQSRYISKADRKQQSESVFHHLCLQYKRYGYGTQGLFFSHRQPLAENLQQFFLTLMNGRYDTFLSSPKMYC